MDYDIDPYTGAMRPVGVKLVHFTGTPGAADYEYPEGTLGFDDATDDLYYLQDVTGTTATWAKLN